MKIFIYVTILLISFGCDKGSHHEVENSTIYVYDSHVHLMSPELVRDWKEMGIPFSRSAATYTDVDTILSLNEAERMDLIGMGYVYTNPEYYQGEDAQDRLIAENNYLIDAALKHPKRITPYIAIDPLKAHAITELDRCYGKYHQIGVKLHFSTSQVYLTEPAHLVEVRSLFEAIAAYQLPVLLHFDNWHSKFGRPDLELLVDSILTDLPPVHLQIAHFGTSGGFNDKTRRFLDAYIALRKEGRIPDQHKIKLDISAVALDKDSEGVSKLSKAEFGILRQYVEKIGFSNIVFGSDYPLYTSRDYMRVLQKQLEITDDELKIIMK